ncbi:hypothetical protein [Parasitella parasitica]|uniref:Uncharacterized protein n=1 Tax=Parasitella parasitica TaxID=35722 RepID=A0A0B7N0M1_9FUNG|nr:hypothetical protein [Parasitella parasitica]
MTASSATDNIMNDMKILSLDHDHDDNAYPYYYPDDATSDSTVTATAKDLHRNTTEKNSNDWIEEIEHSFGSSCNDNNSYSLNDFSARETTIMQSYLEPNRPHIAQRTAVKQKSKFSAMKQKMKRVFCMSPSGNQKQQHTDKLQSLSQSSLPVFPTTSCDARWSPSTDSSICSSSTLRPPDQTSTHSSNSNASSCKSFRYRHSCGLHSSSVGDIGTPFATTAPTKRLSTVSKIKNRFSRTPSLGTLPISVPPPPIKGILKKHPSSTRTTAATTTRMQSTSANLGAVPRRERNRWSNARFSVYSNNKSCYTVLSLMSNNNNKRKSQPLDPRYQHYEQKGRILRFNEIVDVEETYAKEDYDRSSDAEAICTRLNAVVATQIKQELNYFKLHEMVVHELSRGNTHFFM